MFQFEANFAKPKTQIGGLYNRSIDKFNTVDSSIVPRHSYQSNVPDRLHEPLPF